MKHLASDQLIDAVDDTLSLDARRHLETCARCRAQREELSLALRATQHTDVPEPSPLFWELFSGRVRSAIAAENAPAQEWSHWLRLPVLAPLAGLAIVIGALVVTLPNGTGTLPVDVAQTQTDVLLNDDGWMLVADAVGDIDWDTATAAGLTVAPGAADQVVMELTADERRELTSILQAELLRAKS
ncbi:MAG: hypothetical protein ACRD2N_18105 [Vicinamibacterales bacterium]